MTSNRSSTVTGTIKVRWTFKPRHNGRKRKDGPGISPRDIEPGNIPRITRLMALAIKFDGLVRRGEVRDYADLARLGYVTRARITQIMTTACEQSEQTGRERRKARVRRTALAQRGRNLLNLAPDIQEEILFLPRTVKGRDPIRERDVRPIAAVPHWNRQRKMWKALLKERMPKLPDAQDAARAAR